MDGRHLSQLLEEAARRRPDHTAVEDEHGRRQSYAELMRGADRLAARLVRWGVDRGDRVGLWLPKGLEAVTAIHGTLRTGSSYVPVDATGPAARAAAILAASGVKRLKLGLRRGAIVFNCRSSVWWRDARGAMASRWHLYRCGGSDVFRGAPGARDVTGHTSSNGPR